MQTLLRFHIIIFGNFQDVKADTETLEFFFAKFLPLGLVPNQYPEHNFDIGTEVKQNTVNRVALTSPDNCWDIKFGEERITIIYNVDLSNPVIIEVESFIEKCFEYLKLFEEKFNKRYHRVGFISEHLDAAENASDSYYKISKPLEIFKEDIPVDYSTKMGFRRDIKEINEIFNINNSVNFINAELQRDSKIIPFKGLHLIIDINTISENKVLRFNSEKAREALLEMAKINIVINKENSKLAE